jgi:PAS domain S-box-containing protein
MTLRRLNTATLNLRMNFLVNLFSSDGFMPHGHCYLWRPGVLWLHIVSDALIALAYYSIPFTLVYFVRKRRDFEFDWMFLCFALFIITCGTTHLMEIVVIWHPVYWLSGTIKAITALTSVPTAVLLVKLVPRALQLPSPSALRHVNLALEKEIGERRRAEQELKKLNEDLEQRVSERTEQLRQNQEQLRSLVEQAPVSLAMFDREMRYLVTSKRWVADYGKGHTDLAGLRHYDLHADLPAEWKEAHRRGLVGESLGREEDMWIHADGSQRWLRWAIHPWSDAAGQIGGIIIAAEDITERKRAEQKVRDQLTRLDLLRRITRAIGERQDLQSIFRVVLHNLEEKLPIDFGCVCVRDAAQETLIVSSVHAKDPALAAGVGLSEKQSLAPDQHGLLRCLQGQLVYEPDAREAGFPLAQRLAEAGLRSLVVAPLLVESSTVGVLAVARREPGAFRSADCKFLRQLSEHVALASHQTQLYTALQQAYEELRQTQQAVMQQERLRALGQMASGIAHDINNAISPVALYTEMLLGGEPNLSDRAREYIKTIEHAIDDVAATVARMREVYRQREPQLELAPVDLNQAVQQVLHLTRARWSDMSQRRGLHIELTMDLAPQLPPLMGAESEIREALMNLIFNAVDAMPEGGTLRLSTRLLRSATEPAGTESDQVQVEVADTGIGMDEETRRRCLEPFFTTKGERGTGLGLAMVYGVVERHSAGIEIQSAPGQGTSVRLNFPVPSAVGVEPAVPAASRPLLVRLRLLVVDDDPVLLRSLCDILENDGHAVVAANNGQEGIKAFREAQSGSRPFNAVITDLGMPYLDGRKVAGFVKQISPGTPVIMLTGWGRRMAAEGDVPLHVDQLLCKPPKMRDLRQALERWCLPRKESGT